MGLVAISENTAVFGTIGVNINNITNITMIPSPDHTPRDNSDNLYTIAVTFLDGTTLRNNMLITEASTFLIKAGFRFEVDEVYP